MRTLIGLVLDIGLIAQSVPMGPVFPMATGGSGNAPVFVSTARNATGSSDCSVVLSVTNGNTAILWGFSTSVPGTLSVTAGGTATAIMAQYTDSGNLTTGRAWTLPITTTGSVTYTVHDTSSANSIYCAVAQVSGTSVAVDQVSAGANIAAASSTWTAGTTGTTTQANELAIGMFAVKTSGSGDLTPGAGWSFQGQTVTNVGIIALTEYKTLSATGAQTATVTTNGGASVTGGMGFTVTLKAN